MWWLARAEWHLPGDDSWLSDAEAAYANAQRFTKRRVEFLIARWTAKQALCRALALPAVPGTLRRIEVRHEPSGAPLACLDAQPVGLPISLTDRAGWAVCLLGPRPPGTGWASGTPGTGWADPSHGTRGAGWAGTTNGAGLAAGPGAGAGAGRIGCDLELVEARSDAFVRDYLTPSERRYVDAAADRETRYLAANLIWSAKESGLKVLTTGLRRDTRSVEVAVGTGAGGWAELTVRTTEGAAFAGWWCRFGAFILTVATERELPAPASFDDPPLLAAAEPSHTWLHRPETAQPVS